MSALEDRNASAVTLRRGFLFLLAHLMRVVELLEEFDRILDAIDAEIQIVDVLIAGPEPRRLIWRISAVGRQREVRLGTDDGGRFWLRRLRGCARGARANHVEAENRCDKS